MDSILLLPELSARNKAKDGYAYRLTKDGNMHGILNAYFYMLNKPTTVLGIPIVEHVEDLDEFKDLLSIIGFKGSLHYFPYDENIDATRASFKFTNKSYVLGNSVILSTQEQYASVISGIPDVMPDIYLANTSKQIGIEQPCDKWFAKDLEAMHNAKLVFVLDKGQKDLLPEYIKAKTYVRSPNALCNGQFMQRVLNAGLEPKYSEKAVLVPYNLSDASYGTDWSIVQSFEDILLLNPRSSEADNCPKNAKQIGGLTKPNLYKLLAHLYNVYLPVNNNVSHMLYHELAWFGYTYNTETKLWTR